MAPATFPGSEVQRGQEVRETRAQINQAYRDGVREVSNHPVIFIDLNQLKNFRVGPPHHSVHIPTPGYALTRQLERQVEGATEGVIQRIKESSKDGEEYTASRIAREIRNNGPAALPDVKIGGKTYGLALEPSSKYDSKKDLVDAFTEPLDRQTRRAIRENMPGTDSQWMRFAGNHEGAHLNVRDDNKDQLRTLVEEVRADRIASEKAHSRGEGHIALAFKDLRALTAHLDPTHASSTLMHNHADTARDLHVRHALNNDYAITNAVKHNFDWSTYEGKATNPEELLKENPEGYFNAMHKGLASQSVAVMGAYHNDPDNTKRVEAVIEHQIKTDYMRDFEDAWRRRVLGQDVPERAPTQLITQEQEDGYFLQVRTDREKRIIEAEAEAAYPAVFAEFEYDENKLEHYENMDIELKLARNEALVEHAVNPSFETAQKLIYMEQALYWTADLVEYARAAKEGRESEQEEIQVPSLLSDEDRRAYYKERFERQDAVNAESLKVSLSPEASQMATVETKPEIYMAVVEDIPKGAPRIDQNDWKMKTPDGAGMAAVFAASANPAPDAVKIVPAFTPPEQVASVVLAQDAANSSLYTQRSLG